MFTDAELLAYLDEMLSVEKMTAIEAELRNSSEFRDRLIALRNQRDADGHSVGEIWRRERISCPTRHQLGSYLLGATAPAWRDYIEFHVQTVGCRFCAANLDDLRQSAAASPEVLERRQKFFQSSAGIVRNLRPPE